MPRARICLGRVPGRGWSPGPSSSSPRAHPAEPEPVPFAHAPAAGELPRREEQPGSAPSLSQPLPAPPLPSCPPLLPPASPSPGFSPWERGWGGSRTRWALAMPGAGKVGLLRRLSTGTGEGSAQLRSGSAVLTPGPAAPPCPVELGPTRDPPARHPEAASQRSGARSQPCRSPRVRVPGLDTLRPSQLALPRASAGTVWAGI